MPIVDTTTALDQGGTWELTETVNLTLKDDEKPENDMQEEATSDYASTESEIDISEIRYEEVWKNADETVKKGVVELWDDQTGGKMNEGMKQKRLEMICVVAYHEKKVVAVSTIRIEPSRGHQGLWCKIGFFRCMVHQDYQRKGIAKQLALRCKIVLGDYSKEHAGERIHAMGMNLKASLLGERGQQPFWPELGMVVAGYNDQNIQYRLAWFDHVRLEY